MPGPLEGVRVMDLTAVLLGPFATQHMADMGADVIKVEPPEGDLLRVSGGSMGRDKSMGPIYMAANRNKRSLCLDLKKPAACAVLKELIRTADLFIHNSRPAAIERLGLGYEDLKKINPSIIYAYSLGYRDANGNITGRYDKEYLLALGEYLPLSDTFPILYDWSPNSGKFSKGTKLDALLVMPERKSSNAGKGKFPLVKPVLGSLELLPLRLCATGG
jgi:hypothetical protein